MNLLFSSLLFSSLLFSSLLKKSQPSSQNYPVENSPENFQKNFKPLHEGPLFQVAMSPVTTKYENPKKQRGPRKSKETQRRGDDEAKRNAVLLAEQKRRGVLQSGFSGLEKIVPCPEGTRYSKAQLLNRGDLPFLFSFSSKLFSSTCRLSKLPLILTSVRIY